MSTIWARPTMSMPLYDADACTTVPCYVYDIWLSGYAMGTQCERRAFIKKPRNACLEFLSTIIIIDTIYADVCNFFFCVC